MRPGSPPTHSRRIPLAPQGPHGFERTVALAIDDDAAVITVMFAKRGRVVDADNVVIRLIDTGRGFEEAKVKQDELEP